MFIREKSFVFRQFLAAFSLCTHCTRISHFVCTFTFSKFNRCQLIQFCDYCPIWLCLMSSTRSLPAARFVCHFAFVCPLSFHISWNRWASLLVYILNVFVKRELSTSKPETADHLSWWNCLFCFPHLSVDSSFWLSLSLTLSLFLSFPLSPSLLTFASFQLIHFILSVFITVLVTFFHLFAIVGIVSIAFHFLNWLLSISDCFNGILGI